MADEDETKKGKKGERVVQCETEPEIVWVKGRGTLKELAVEGMHNNFQLVVNCILHNVCELKHLPSLKLLMDMANAVCRDGEAPEEAYRSLAEELWASYQGMQKELGTGNEE